MSEIDFIPNWIYTFLVLPILVLFKQQFSNSSRITVLESKDRIDDEKIKRICDSNGSLEEKVNQLIGRVDEHLRKSS